MLLLKHVQTGGIVGQVRSLVMLYIGSLCFVWKTNTNAVATNVSFSDSSFFELLSRNGYLGFSVGATKNA